MQKTWHCFVQADSQNIVVIILAQFNYYLKTQQSFTVIVIYLIC